MWSNVEERITDGVSGLEPQGQPTVLFAGASSKGKENIPLTLGRKSLVSSVLGYGQLAQTLADCQKNMGDAPLLAVRAEAEAGGVQGVSASEGAGDIIISGEPLFACRIGVEILNGEEISLRWEGAKNLNQRAAIPKSGEIELEDLGLSLALPASYKAGDSWAFSTTAPKASYESLSKAVRCALDVYTPEAVIICQDADAKEAALWAAEAEIYFEAEHKPVHFILQTALDASLPLEEAISAKTAEFAKTDARFVSVLCQPGTVIEGSVLQKRQPLGFLAATLTKSSVSQSIGATRWFAVPNFAFPEGWNNSHSRSLDEARFITLRSYAGLNGIFWSNGRTLAGDSSDYRFIEIVRTVHRAVRLARRAVLPCIHAPGDEKGVKEILARIRTALTAMTDSSPVELLGFELDAPEGQDIANKGLMVEISLYGVPIVRKIVLNFAYKYQNAGA